MEELRTDGNVRNLCDNAVLLISWLCDIKYLLDKLEVDEYSSEVIKTGFLARALSSEDNPDFNNLPKLYEKLNLGFLRTPNEKSEITVEDKKWLFKQLDRAYSKTDNNWLKTLKLNFESELIDSSTIFCLVRDENRQLIGIIKTKPTCNESTWYNGTFYVDVKYAKNFGIGRLLKMMAAYSRPENVKKVIGSVATYNDTASVFLEAYGGALTSFVTEGSDVGYESKPLFRLVYDSIYKTLKSKYLTNNEIKALVKSTEQDTNISPSAFKINANVGKDQEFLTLAKEKFSEGYVLGRLIYETKENDSKKMDISKGYAVFELPDYKP